MIPASGGGPCPDCGGQHPAGACPEDPSGQTLVASRNANDELEGVDEPTRVRIALPQDPLIGRTLGHFTLLRALGQGSFSRVYLAEHSVIGSRVALKVAEPHVARDPELLQRFVGEARAANVVRHENVVRIHDIGTFDGGRYYFVMDFLAGETLAARCARGPLTLPETLPLLAQLCAGLGAAHAAGVVHRDIKPENVFLVPSAGEHLVKIVDFGIARRARLQQGERRTMVGTVLGTPLYIAPEQAFGGEVDGRADIYSLGVMMFFMATGKLPFTHPNTTELLRMHALKPPPAPRSLNPSLHPEYEKIILRCMAKKPADRFASMAELATTCARLQGARAPSPAASAPASAPANGLLTEVTRIERAPEEDHYAVIGVPPESTLSAIQAACQRLVELLCSPKARGGSPDEQARLERVRTRVALAEEQLIDPRQRAAHDAGRGNFVGVARCFEAGLDAATASALRERHHATRPHLRTILKPIQAKADSREQAGDVQGALEALAMLLKLDPLDLSLLRRYSALRRQLKK